MIEHEIERLDRYLTHKGINDNRFTEITGISQGWIGKAREKKSSLTKKTRPKILASFPDLNPAWLTTGHGEMIISAANKNLTPAESSLYFELRGKFMQIEKKYHELLEKHIITIEQKESLAKELEELQKEIKRKTKGFLK